MSSRGGTSNFSDGGGTALHGGGQPLHGGGSPPIPPTVDNPGRVHKTHMSPLKINKIKVNLGPIVIYSNVTAIVLRLKLGWVGKSRI